MNDELKAQLLRKVLEHHAPGVATEHLDLTGLVQQLHALKASGALSGPHVVDLSGLLGGGITITTQSQSFEGGGAPMNLAALMQTFLGGAAGAGAVTQMPGLYGPAAGLGAIKQRDPGFTEQGFLAHASRTFYQVIEAWTERRPEVSRPLMSDALWEQHRVQTEQLLREGRRNVVGDLTLDGLSVVNAQADQAADTIGVGIQYRCVDYEVDARGKRTHGDTKQRAKHDTWWFQRAAGTLTPPPGAAPAQHCTACGAPVDGGSSGRCAYCHTLLNSGAAGWMLTRVDQQPG